MAMRSRCSSPLILALGLWLSLGTGAATAQLVQQPDEFLQSGMQTPNFPPAGDWAEVITVTPRWLVIQNRTGQQFPVSLDAVREFVIRWPIDPGSISSSALVETIGLDLGSNRVRTDHVDVFEGQARGLVRPQFQQIIGFNRRPTAFDIQNKNIYGVYIPLLPGEDQIPNRLHVCGPVVGLNPLQIAVGGNNSVAVLPSDGGLFFSQVTPGSPSQLRPKDLVYVVPIDINIKSLVLGQMVAYKTIPLSQFVP